METGVFICSGCNIGESIDVSALQDIALSECKVKSCCSHPFLCSKEGIDKMNSDITEQQLSKIVIAACSHRQQADAFQFGNKVYVERVNLREQVSWSHKPGDEDTLMLAEDLLRMGIAKAKYSINPEPYIGDNLSSDILVVGGGITGITSALEAAKAGYNIILVEREKDLGGYMKELHKVYPQHAPFTQMEECNIPARVLDILAFDNITIKTSAEVVKVSGQPGMFDVELLQNGNRENHRVAAIIMANGWKPYDANKLTKYGYTENSNVITSLELEIMARDGKIIRPSDGKTAKSVLFIQCAGSRDKEHLSYCSNYCCATSLKQTQYIRNINKDSLVYIVYKDIRTPGHNEVFYKTVQNDDQVFFTKGDIVQLGQHGDEVVVTLSDKLLGEEINIKVDLVVLAIGMTPASTEDLNLTYRQGKGLPMLKYDFPDSHFICFPYETRRTGIYAAGTVRAPMDSKACMEDAQGATMKAIQCIENLKSGKALHPRSGDLSYPELSLERCTDCKRCTEECPFSSYDETDKGTPLPNPNRCRRCGICLGACPERIINFSNYSINAVSEMIKAVHIPDEFDEKPRILAFVCENDAYPAFDMAGLKRLEYSPYVRIIPVRCIGSVNKIWISDALSKGYDGIMLFGCKPGDDYQCHFIQGSELTQKRGENIQETLDKMMLESERIHTVFLEINEYDKIPEIIEEYMETIETIGYNPFKGM
ncbi:MAG: FAD-dependent oxidoreductase [Bacteroidales bacterium]|nr:FAD-dependent oxidoreductase [Bacteroidales bacterium]